MLRKWSSFEEWNSPARGAQGNGDKCTYSFSPNSWIEGTSFEIWAYILDNIKV